MFISDLAGMVVKPVVKGVATISKTVVEEASDSTIGKILAGAIVLGGITYVACKAPSIYNKD